MITTSTAWNRIHQQQLLPESFVEISLEVADATVADEVDEITGENISGISTLNTLLRDDVGIPYATLEHNQWMLDGEMLFAPDALYSSTNPVGFVSDDDSPCAVEIAFPEVRTKEIQGFTITWSERLGEYPTDFSVQVYGNEESLGYVRVNNNSSVVSQVALPVSDYDYVTITVYDWSIPGHRKRIDRIVFGHVLTFEKGDILDYAHEMHGCISSGELSSKSISFSVDNTDGRWNPLNPSGLERYLSEQQRVKVRYGYDIDGRVEMIRVGCFYLSEWKVSQNGMGAEFVAKDFLSFLLNIPYVPRRSEQTFNDYLSRIRELAGAFGSKIERMSGYPAVLQENTALGLNLSKDYNCAEVLQMCANAMCWMIYHGWDHVWIGPFWTTYLSYGITSDLSYSYPEVELSKPLKSVAVTYGEDQTYELSVSSAGETQTVNNPFVCTESRAMAVATWVRRNLAARKTITGEFRANPCLELFDQVSVETKYGKSNVVITDLKYQYSGSFRATYTGVVY